MTSNENLVRVVRRTDLNSARRQRPRPVVGVVSALRTRITITAQPDGALEIKAISNISGFSNGQNARTAAATVQGLIDLFIEQNLSGDRRETGQSLTRPRRGAAPPRGRAAGGRAAPGRVRAALHGRAARHRLDQRPDDRGAHRAFQSRAADRRRPGRRSNAMRGQLAATPQTIPGVGGDNNGTASGQIAQLEGQINQNLARGWTESHPDIVYARQQIARLRPYAAPSAARAIPAACPTRPTSRCAR